MTSIREDPEYRERARRKILEKKIEMYYNTLSWEVGLASRLKSQRGDSRWLEEKS